MFSQRTNVRPTAVLRTRSGEAILLDLDRWRAAPDVFEMALLEGVPEPILDIGCGPGRLVVALADRGRRALGVDHSPTAVAEARDRGGVAVCRSIFDPVPAEGRWRSVLLFDGNIGIGGDPVALLARTRELLDHGGVAVIEVEPPGSPTDRIEVRVEAGGATSSWFRWARVSADDISAILLDGGLLPEGLEQHGDRWFARAVRP